MFNFNNLGINFTYNPWKKTHKTKSKKKNVLFFTFLSLLLFIMGSMGTYFFLYTPIKKVTESRSWIKVPAKIIASEVKKKSVRANNDWITNYSIQVSYHYNFDNAEYIGDRYDFFRSLNKYTSEQEEVYNVIKRHPIGTTVMCYVNPKNPKESVICRNIYYKSLLTGVIPLLLMLGGMAIMVGICVKNIKLFRKQR
ncbi:MAG: DUF3592 domain-containing protein [Bacteroidaceae bacterium]|nr:DUF3592 domain-containing protein [Bacteroidaceae bacterium]